MRCHSIRQYAHLVNCNIKLHKGRPPTLLSPSLWIYCLPHCGFNQHTATLLLLALLVYQAMEKTRGF